MFSKATLILAETLVRLADDLTRADEPLPAVVVGDGFDETLTDTGAALARSVTLDLGTTANTHDRAYPARS